ncbi:DUF5681 domain-containing protein [uncultured Rhodospira sp.]|uniref:DUF5681 domain-containing protein n=1 Tax=uncultured Rhodospira sp. TaxID=1936189 RepID=UPI0026291733|nr:DUF5681 domain-containing protein [uncultured Rhodospira sp.]
MTDDTRNNGGATEGRDEKGRFAPGNPGRPRGARHKATLAVEAILDGEAEALTRRAIELAMEGDTTALRLCLERIAPPRKDAPIRFDLPAIARATDAAGAMSALLASVAAGDVTPQEAAGVAGLIEAWRKTKETSDLESRIAVLEAARQKS